MSSMVQPLVTYGRMIKLSHSIFAMPFALAAAALAARSHPVSVGQIFWIVWCMVMARSSAMGFNRLVDRKYDAMNPRTQIREIPSGQISVSAAWMFTIGSGALFVMGAAILGKTTLLLSPVALVVVWGYSLTKRFTALCHVVLGIALAISPTAAWIALTDSWGWTPAILSAIVGTWVAGFDILYACQDADFDRGLGLHSIPAALGVRGALWVSAVLHVGTVALLIALPATIALSWPYVVGVLVLSGVLAYEHAIVSPGDLSRINKAFFDLNGYVSLCFLGFVLIS